MPKIIPIIKGTIDLTGALHIEDDKKLFEWLRVLKGKEVWIRIEPAKKPRTLNQNAYYHGVALPLIVNAVSNVWGGDAQNEDICHLLRKNYAEARKECFTLGNKQFSRIKSTADMNSTEMGEFLTWLNDFAKDFLCIDLPDPEEFKNNPQFWVEGE